MLKAAAFGGPVHESFHVFAIFPSEVKEFGSAHVGGFGSQKCLKPPANVWALPRFETIAPSRAPVELQGLKHFLRHGRFAQPL